MPLRAEPSGITESAPVRRHVSQSKNQSPQEAVEFDEFLYGVLAAEPFR